MERIINKKISVWVVEDNVLYKDNIVSLMNEQSDINCDKYFLSCEEAISALETTPTPDVVLHDIGFEGMNGITCVGIMKRKNPSIQIIMVTVYDDDDSIFDALCAGATGYLLKSSPETMIIQSIRDVFSGGSPMNSTIARKTIEMFSKMHTVSREYGLTVREKEILEQIVQGYSNKIIADQFNISPHTIDAHLRKVYEKLHVHTRTAAAAKAIKERLF
ncbi:MAG: response regulator transcription factor [Bacteroidota bacterium]